MDLNRDTAQIKYEPITAQPNDFTILQKVDTIDCNVSLLAFPPLVSGHWTYWLRHKDNKEEEERQKGLLSSSPFKIPALAYLLKSEYKIYY